MGSTATISVPADEPDDEYGWDVEEENGIWIQNRANGQTSVDSTRIREDMFRKICVLGLGHFSKVFLVQKIDTEEYFAMKQMAKSQLIQKSEFEQVLTGERALCFSVLATPVFDNAVCTVVFLFLNPQANGGELYHHVKTFGPMSEDRTRLYVAEIFLAIAYLHRHKVIYRDLKLENILLDSEGHVVLADFNLAKQLAETLERTTSFCGSIDTVAPEILHRRYDVHHAAEGYSYLVDYWSLGVVAYELLFGLPPFYGETPRQSYQNIMSQKLRFPQKPHVSAKCKSFIQKILQKNPRKRLTARGVFRHPWFASLSWRSVYRRETKPEFVPELAGDADCRYISTEFSSQPVSEPLSLAPPVRGPMGACFQGFSFSNAHITMSQMRKRSFRNSPASHLRTPLSIDGDEDEDVQFVGDTRTVTIEGRPSDVSEDAADIDTLLDEEFSLLDMDEVGDG